MVEYIIIAIACNIKLYFDRFFLTFGISIYKLLFTIKMASPYKINLNLTIAKISALRELKLLFIMENQIPNRPRKYWINPFIIKRGEMDIDTHLLNDLCWDNDDSNFRNFTRFGKDQFEKILELVSSLNYNALCFVINHEIINYFRFEIKLQKRIR